jgi:hypothetical protein
MDGMGLSGMEDGEMSDGIRDGLKWMGCGWPVEIAPGGGAAKPDDGRPEVRWMEKEGNGLKGAPLNGGQVSLWPTISTPPYLVVLRVASDKQGAGLRVKLNPVEAKQLAWELVVMAKESEKRAWIEKENVRAEVRAARERAVGPELVEAVRQFITAVKHPMAAETNHWVGCPGPLFSKMADLVRDVDAETGT